MSEVCKAIKGVIAQKGIEPFQTVESAFDVIRSLEGITPLERNLLIRCAQYQLFPESVFENESAANRNAQRIASVLIKRHGIEEKAADSMAADICMGFARGSVNITVTQEEKAPVKAPTAAPRENQKEEKSKKKGLFSFFKRG